MTLTKHIAAEQLRALDLHPGDTLRVIAEDGAIALVQIERPSEEALTERAKGKASEWLRTAKGSVHARVDESANDVRTAYYAAKYGVK